MQRKFLNARSPLRLLEKGLHGGLGPGNVGVVLAGHGVGKTAFLVAVALDELLRGGRVLHVCLDATVSHVRAHYDTAFEDLASTTHLEDEAMVHAEIDRLRSIRVYPPNAMSASKLRDAVKLEVEAGARPSLIVLEGLELETLQSGELAELKALAKELAAEVWLSAPSAEEGPTEKPGWMDRLDAELSVVLTLEPSDDTVALRALKDHDNPDVATLHVSLDPRTLLLVRS
ncbi:MAG: hypothetical protein HKP30_14895 [Myxococcales bacterium]|nr:hypothetical protein [Myxococcales bacterium]